MKREAMFYAKLCLLIGLVKVLTIAEAVEAVEAVEPQIIFFYGDSVNCNQTYELSDAVNILRHPKFNKHFKTVLYIHGFVESPASATVQLIVNAYIKRGKFNILVLDWSTFVSGSYATAVTNSNEVGPTISKQLINLFHKGLNILHFHIVGHSLGGQLSGIIGRSVISLSQNKMKLLRISALDPAFPLFYPPRNVTLPINVNDATLVDIIHTDADKYGSPINTGCVDFVVNEGTRFQPGCPVGNFTALSTDDTCSHQRSVALWAESVSNRARRFLATNSDNKFIKINMGIDCPIFSLAGTYTVQTNAEPPYSLRHY